MPGRIWRFAFPILKGFDARELFSPQEKFLHEQFNALSAKVEHMTALLEKASKK